MKKNILLLLLFSLFSQGEILSSAFAEVPRGGNETLARQSPSYAQDTDETPLAKAAYVPGGSRVVTAPAQMPMTHLPPPAPDRRPPMKAPITGYEYPRGQYVQCFCKRCDNYFLLYLCYCGRALYVLPSNAIMCGTITCVASVIWPIIFCDGDETPCTMAKNGAIKAISAYKDLVCCPGYLSQENVVCPRDCCCKAIDDVERDDDRCPCCCVDEPCCYKRL